MKSQKEYSNNMKSQKEYSKEYESDIAKNVNPCKYYNECLIIL